MADLIHLSQIKGGLTLRSDVDTLQASYSALKVLTDIAKTDERVGAALAWTIVSEGDPLTPNPLKLEATGNFTTNLVATDTVKISGEANNVIVSSTYAAGKTTIVLTSAVVGAGPFTVTEYFVTAKYNANELLAALKFTVDGLAGVGGSGTSIDERIQAAKDDLQGKIDLINNKEIKDRIKIQGDLVTTTNLSQIGASNGWTIYDTTPTKLVVTGDVTASLAIGDFVRVSGVNNDLAKEISAIDYNVTEAGKTVMVISSPVVGAGPFSVSKLVSPTSTFTPSLSTELLAKIQFEGSSNFTVYNTDNTPIFKLDGSTLKYNYVTGLLDGIAAVRDPEDHNPLDGVSYVPKVGTVTAKTFPIATFMFKDLASDYLLDNMELDTASYQQAVDQIVTDLAQDQDLIDAIKLLVGTQTVQDQITLITNALATRVTSLETTRTTLLGADTVAGSIAQLIKVETDRAVLAEGGLDGRLDTLEASASTPGSVAAAVKTETDRAELAEGALDSRLDTIEGTGAGSITAAVAAEAGLRESADTAAHVVQHNENLDRIFDIATINAVTDVTDAFTATAAQTEFVLSQVPNATPIIMNINGLDYYENDTFTVVRGTKTVTWVFVAPSGFDLEAGMVIHIKYKNTATVAAPSYIS